jgi:Ca2+-binding EF-hand superfamily protein
MSETPEEKITELRKVFDKFDKDENSTIDWDEFCVMVDELVGDQNLEEKSLAFHLIDTDHSGQISFEEFCAWWGRQ